MFARFAEEMDNNKGHETLFVLAVTTSSAPPMTNFLRDSIRKMD